MLPLLNHQIVGEGNAITFIHGFSLDGRMWRPQVEAFKSTHRVLTLDMPGFGQKPFHEGEISAVEEIIRLLDHYGIDKTHVLGLSYGGAVALDFALHRPERLRSLTLADAMLLGRPTGVVNWNECAELAQRGERKEAFENWMTGYAFARACSNPALNAEVRAIIGDYEMGHWTGKVGTKWHSGAPEAQLETIKLPTMVLNGEFDIPEFLVNAEIMASKIPGARKEIIPGVGHMTNIEAPERFNAVLLDFVNSVDARESN